MTESLFSCCSGIVRDKDGYKIIFLSGSSGNTVILWIWCMKMSKLIYAQLKRVHFIFCKLYLIKADLIKNRKNTLRLEIQKSGVYIPYVYCFIFISLFSNFPWKNLHYIFHVFKFLCIGKIYTYININSG